MSPALQIMTFDGTIEHISCITQHGDFGPMKHQAVLENVGPDRNGRSYQRCGSQTLNQLVIFMKSSIEVCHNLSYARQSK